MACLAVKLGSLTGKRWAWYKILGFLVVLNVCFFVVLNVCLFVVLNVWFFFVLNVCVFCLEYLFF